MIDARDIQVSLGQKQVLRGVDMQAKPGQVTMIVGPNGSGKTTFLRALTGDVDHGGSLHLNGQDITGFPSWKLASLRGVLPQATSLAFPFTVIEVVRLGLLAGHSSQDDTLPRQALAKVGLAGYEGRFFQELSGGEQQRAQLARVLCQVWKPVSEDGAPRWLFLDEPVAALDIGHQLQVMNIARDFARAGGGVIAVMHDLNLTGLYADHIVMLTDGRVLASGPTGQVLTRANLSRAYDCDVCPALLPGLGATVVHPACVSLHGGRTPWSGQGTEG